MNQNTCTLEKPILLIGKTQTNLSHQKKMNGLLISPAVKTEKLLNNEFVGIVVLLTTSLPIVLPTNVTDARNLATSLLNALNKPQDVPPALLARTLTIYTETALIMSAEDAVH
jgi:hypothetical protein